MKDQRSSSNYATSLSAATRLDVFKPCPTLKTNLESKQKHFEIKRSNLFIIETGTVIL